MGRVIDTSVLIAAEQDIRNLKTYWNLQVKTSISL